MSSKIEIFFFEAFEEEQEALKHFLPEKVSAGFTWKTPQELGVSEEPPAPIISIRTQSEIPVAWAGKLEAMITRSTGYDHIKAYKQKANAPELSCGYLPLYCNRAVAEQALLMWLSLQRNLKSQLSQFSSFHRDGLTGSETYQKTLLVVGVGNIGSEVVKIGHGLGMNVLCYDIDSSKYPEENYVGLEEGVTQADIIVCSMNLTPENNGLLNYDLLKKAKQGVILVNVSRGEQSPATDLLKLLEEGHLGGVGLDVYSSEKELAVALREKRFPENPELQSLINMAGKHNVIFTPHNAFNTHEAVLNKSEQSIQQFVALKEKGEFIWKVPD